jgi:hypothetical protein
MFGSGTACRFWFQRDNRTPFPTREQGWISR